MINILNAIYKYFKDDEIIILYNSESYNISGLDFDNFYTKFLSKGDEDMKNVFEDAVEYGERKGRIEGRMEGLFKAILDIIEIRFGTEDLEDIREALKSINDLEFLDYLKVQAKKVPSLNEFKRLMDRM